MIAPPPFLHHHLSSLPEPFLEELILWTHVLDVFVCFFLDCSSGNNSHPSCFCRWTLGRSLYIVRRFYVLTSVVLGLLLWPAYYSSSVSDLVAYVSIAQILFLPLSWVLSTRLTFWMYFGCGCNTGAGTVHHLCISALFNLVTKMKWI